MALRPDEAEQFQKLLGVPRMAKLGRDWQHVLDDLEELIGLASWRSQSVACRAEALIHALDATHGEPAPRVFGKWGDAF